MKTNVIATAVLTGILTLVTGSQAMAADVTATGTQQNTVTMLGARDMLIQPASETTGVQLHFAGADRVDFGLAGELVITKANGSLLHYRPDVYQMINGRMRPVTVSYKMEGKDRVTVSFGKFDRNSPLILRRNTSL